MAEFYTVVENAGDEGEQDVRTGFLTSSAAWRWAERHYRKNRLEDMRVQIRRDSPEGRTYVTQIDIWVSPPPEIQP